MSPLADWRRSHSGSSLSALQAVVPAQRLGPCLHEASLSFRESARVKSWVLDAKPC